MRLLHTADWHLGISTGSVSRGPDHDLVLGRILELIDEERVDVLLVAGDVFDTMQPSADAQQRYYRFLARASLTGLQQVVVIGGNHDSATRLDAPADVLQALRVHVVGGLPPLDALADTCLVPLGDADAPEAVALAVPFVHEYRLGIRTTDLDRDATRRAFMDRFAEVYTALVEAARDRWGDVPLVALGHLTVGAGVSRDDYPQEIHQVGSIDALPPELFDGRIDYVALGHIHRGYPASRERRVWYSGTPVALSAREAESERGVLVVDLPGKAGGEVGVRRVTLDPPRRLPVLEGPPDEVEAGIRTLTWAEPLPPLLHLRIRTDGLTSDVRRRLHEAVEVHPETARPTIVDVRQIRTSPLPEPRSRGLPPSSEMEPADIFDLLLGVRGAGDEPEVVRHAFGELASLDDPDDLEARVRAIGALRMEEEER